MTRLHLIGFCLLAMGGCQSLWGGSTKPEPANCVRNPDACGAGQICNPVTEACEDQVDASYQPPDLSTPDMAVGATPPTSFVFPGGLLATVDFPRASTFSLEAQASATIYYTLNSSNPIPGTSYTKSAASPFKLGTIFAGTEIRWFADYGAGYAWEPVHSFVVKSTNTNPADLGYIPEPAVFDLSGSSVVIANAGQQITGSVRYQAWQSTATGYCPGCVIQYVVSAESIGAVGCNNTVTGSGPYPGLSSVVNFSFTAPPNPGRYRLYSGLTLQFFCDGSVADGPDIGEIIVR